MRAIWRLIMLRRGGRLDLLIYPAGGPQKVPIIRDILLLPWALALARNVVLQFHAAGIADALHSRDGLLYRLVRAVYSRSRAAIVMTPFNRIDPEVFGVSDIRIIPHKFRDEFDVALVQRGSDRDVKVRLLYVGHLTPDKGTPQLLEAFARARALHPQIELELVGEPLPPYGLDEVDRSISRLGLQGFVHLRGVLSGEDRRRAFGQADLFVFPSVAPYESFGQVLVQAMMWGLAIVSTDWRGNREVLGAEFSGICFQPEPDLTPSLAAALDEALRRREEWPGQGERNRRFFLKNYDLAKFPDDYPRLAASLLDLQIAPAP